MNQLAEKLGDVEQEIGASLPLPAVEGTPIQIVTLHLLTPAGVKGTVTYQLTNVTNYPGVAMNYPISNPGNEKDMGFANSPDPAGQFTDPLPFDVSGDTATQVLIYDYAAYGHLTATISTGRRTFTIDKDLPLMGSNGLPVAGWFAGTTKINSASLTATADADTIGGGTGSGDGLTAFEEYRGFSVAGQHLRTDPNAKDVFLDLDQALFSLPPNLIGEENLNGVGLLLKLPLQLHFVDPSETKSSDFTGIANSVARIKPVINPNRVGILGSVEQRAIRVADQERGPIFQEPQTGRGADEFTRAFGHAFNDTDDLDTVIYPYTGAGPAPPTHMQVVEYYPRAFEDIAISYGANGVLDSLTDQNGVPVPDCNVTTVVGCDSRNADQQAVERFSLYLFTVKNNASDDFYTTIAYQDCEHLLSPVVVASSEFRQLKVDVVGHEVAHNLAVQHSSVCLDLMYATATDVMSMQLPYALGYSDQAIQQIRLH